MAETASTSSHGAILRISDLSILFDRTGTSFADVLAVNNLNLTVSRGEILALVGESGSGKSLTAKAVLGLLPAAAQQRGSIQLDGHEVLGASESKLNQLRGTTAAMIFQEPQTALNPVQTIGRQIIEALRHRPGFDRRQARQRVVELLKSVEIPDPEKRTDWYPHQLSGGQKQRVVIALALSGDPELLIADEPTTALDVTVQAEILSLLRRLRDERGTAILLITHNMGVVADIADTVVVLRQGEVQEQATVNSLFAHPQADYTRQLLASVPQLVISEPSTAPSPANETVDPPAVSFSDVTVTFSSRHRSEEFVALNSVSLSVAHGEVLGVVGESGSGKSTLGRVALNLQRSYTGTVQVAGHDLGNISRKELRLLRKNIALIHQDPAASLNPRISVETSIAEPLAVHGVGDKNTRRARVRELLDAVQLPTDFADRLPAELSGGQRQRVALARALALGPTLLVADEPTSALDVSVQAKVLELFVQLRHEFGFAAMFISHDLAVVNEVSDRVAVLKSGQLREIGPPGEVFWNSPDPYTTALVKAVPIPDPPRQRQRHKAAH